MGTQRAGEGIERGQVVSIRGARLKYSQITEDGVFKILEGALDVEGFVVFYVGRAVGSD